MKPTSTFRGASIHGDFNQGHASLFSSCIPAEKEPVYTNHGDCQPLIKLDKPFCEYYGFKINKYVNVSTNAQKFWNHDLWETQEVYYKVYRKLPNMSTSPECIDQARFLGCYLNLPGCDRTTSIFRPRKFCKESCLYFEKECRTFVKAVKDILLPIYPTKEALLNCLEKPSRNAGDSPECVYYNRKESLEKEGMLVSQSIIGISDSARRKELCQCIIVQILLNKPIMYNVE